MRGRHTSEMTGTQVKEYHLHEKETSLDTESMMTERSKGDLISIHNLRHVGERKIAFHGGSKGAACHDSHLVRAKTVEKDRAR